MVGGIPYNTIKARVAIAKLVVFLGLDAHLGRLASDQSTGRAWVLQRGIVLAHLEVIASALTREWREWSRSRHVSRTKVM